MLTLSDGREVKIDLRKLTVSEYRAMFEPGHEFEEEEQTLAKVIDWTVDDLHAMTLYDNKRLWKAFFDTCKKPIDEDDPKA